MMKAHGKFRASLGHDKLPNKEHVLGEWEAYNNLPLDDRHDFVTYWIKNYQKFPLLSRLALSFHYTKLSTADVERCFSISRRALEGRFSLSSENLMRTMTLRNRLKCFGFRKEMTPLQSFDDHGWLDDISEDSSDSDMDDYISLGSESDEEV